MPSDTFFHLPAEKREKFLAAAREEFARTAYEDVSINRIIRAAEIPRGSFYMYFQDKRELFRYVLEEYIRQAADLVVEELHRREGDLFAVALSFYDQAQRQTGGEPQPLRAFLATIRRNAALRPERVFPGRNCADLLERITAAVDLDRLDLQDPEDLKCVLYVLIPATIDAICSEPSPHSRARFVRLLSILQRGMSKEKHPAQTAQV